MYHYIKSILYRNTLIYNSYDRVRNIFKNNIKILYLIFSKNMILINLYYFFNQSYIAQKKKNLIGKYKFIKQRGGLSKLRRNIHRIEKGMIIKNRKKIFADKYIKETIILFEEITRNKEVSKKNKDWFFNILKEYFNIVDKKNKNIKESFNIFSKIIYEPNKKNRVPFLNKNIKTNIKYEDLLKLSKDRKSTRYFLNKKPEIQKIKKAIKIGIQSPSACNRQPFKFYICQSEKILKNIREIPVGINGFSSNIPTLIVVVSDYSYYENERDRNLIFIDASLAISNFLLANEVLGLGSCCLNWASIKNKDTQIKKELNLEETEQVVMFIAVGYKDEKEKTPYSEKKV